MNVHRALMPLVARILREISSRQDIVLVYLDAQANMHIMSAATRSADRRAHEEPGSVVGTYGAGVDPQHIIEDLGATIARGGYDL